MTRAIRLQQLAAAALLACAAHGSAWSQVTVNTMQARGSYLLGSDGLVDLVQNYPGQNPVDVLEFPFSNGNSAGLHSYGSLDGIFGSRSSGAGVYEVTGGFSIGLTIRNNASTAQNARFSFYITPGLLSNDLGGTGQFVGIPTLLAANAVVCDLVCPGGEDLSPPAAALPAVANPLTGTQFVEAGVNFDIRKNGSSVWGSNAVLRTDAAGTNFSQSGINLYSGSDRYYAINGGSYEVDLGVIGAGESITLDYDLTTLARGNAPAGAPVEVPEITFVVPDQWVDFCPGCGYGYGGSFQPGETVTIPAHTLEPAPSGSQSSSGDPFSVGFNGPALDIYNFRAASLPPGVAPFDVSFTQAVPEPATYGMMALGLLALGGVVRRRRGA